MTLRDGGFFSQLANLGDMYQPGGDTAGGTMADLQNTVTSLNKAFGALGDPADMAGNIRRLQNGISQLASGAQALATGVHTLADSNIEMLSGMSQIATQLQNSARSSAGSTTQRLLPPG